MIESTPPPPFDTAQFMQNAQAQHPELAALTNVDPRQFNRTATSLLSLEWVLRGDYAALTSCQPDDPYKLRPAQFDELASYTDDILTTLEDRTAMRGALALYGMSKVHPAGMPELLGTRQAQDITPSLADLSPTAQFAVRATLDTPYKLGQLMLGENMPASMLDLEGMDQPTLDFYNLFSFYNISGAAGHVRQDGSAVATSATWENFKMAASALGKLPHSSPNVVYDSFLSQKAEQLGLPDIGNNRSRALTRLGLMLHHNTPQQTEQLAGVYAQSLPSTRDTLDYELARTGIGDGCAVLPFGAPALFDSLRQGYGDRMADAEAASELALLTSCNTLGQAMLRARRHMGRRLDSGVYTLRLDGLAPTAAADPTLLHGQGITIHETDDPLVGVVVLKS